ncbi:MAG: hypothetical protein E4H02_12830 [Lentisphaerales bacterium]|jgi:hypothetical protein|nr:MAG: hypothetical protein E4H02_12830 [Lentisphaerales bacterium]
MQKTVNISVRNKNSRYVALDLRKQNEVIAEGRTAASVADKARKTGRQFSMMFVPKRGKTYVF